MIGLLRSACSQAAPTFKSESPHSTVWLLKPRDGVETPYDIYLFV